MLCLTWLRIVLPESYRHSPGASGNALGIVPHPFPDSRSRVSTSVWIRDASTYASLGLPVLPFHVIDDVGRCSCGARRCPHPGRHPRFEDWVGEVATDPLNVAPWGDLWEEARTGVALGARAGLAAVEVGQGGRMDWRDLARVFRVPRVPAFVDAAEGTTRYLFRHPEVVGQRYAIAPGVELVLGGEAHLLPASHESVRGGRYWEVRPSEARPREVPPSLLQRVGIAAPSTHEGPVPPGGLPPFRSGGALRAYEELALPYLAYPWAMQGSVTGVLGAPKTSGKTQWLLHLAAAVASGNPFMDEHTRRSGVAYLTGQSHRSIRRSIDDAGLDDDRMDSVSFLSARDVGRMRWGLFTDDLARRCVCDGIKLVIIDSLDDFRHRGEEDADDVVEALVALAERDLAVVVSVAADVGAGGLAGAVAGLGRLGAAADTVLGITAFDGDRRCRRVQALSRHRDACADVVAEWQSSRSGAVYGVKDAERVLGPLFDGRGDGASDSESVLTSITPARPPAVA
ncbi:MAG: AAA family ATPase [Rubricoccaceae bacterium]|nr:AAA family ATPase [Rubricoccaceae bacterium]